MNRRKSNPRTLPFLLSGVFLSAGIAFVFRRSFLGDIKEQSDAWYKEEDIAGQSLLRSAISESWTTERKKKQ